MEKRFAKIRIHQGITYFKRRMPFEEIADQTERLGWKCGRASQHGMNAKSHLENPHESKAAHSYEGAMLNMFFWEGYSLTH